VIVLYTPPHAGYCLQDAVRSVLLGYRRMIMDAARTKALADQMLEDSPRANYNLLIRNCSISYERTIAQLRQQADTLIREYLVPTKRSNPMFKPGDVLTVTTVEGGEETTHYNMKVIEYDEPLLKVEQHGKISIYNVRSPLFAKALPQNQG
jgi:hypothetical protein